MVTHHIDSVTGFVIPQIMLTFLEVFKDAEPEVIESNARRRTVSFVLDTSAGGHIDKHQVSLVLSERWHRWSPAMITRKLIRDEKRLRRKFVEQFGDVRFRFAHTMIVMGRFTRGVWRAVKEYNAGRPRYEPVTLGYLARKFAPDLYWSENDVDWDTRIIFVDITEFLRRARVSIENARRYIRIFFMTLSKALKMLARFYVQRAQALIDRLHELGVEKPYGVFRRKIGLFNSIAERISMKIKQWVEEARARILDEMPNRATITWSRQETGPPALVGYNDRYEVVEDEEAEEPYEVIR